jgi:hypothetical protein
LCSYLLGFAIAQTFLDAQIWFVGRHLLLVYVIGSMLIIFQARELFQASGPTFRLLCLCICIAIVCAGGLRTSNKIRIAHHDGLGLTSKRWRNSSLVGEVRELDNSVPIVSNSRAMVYLLTGKIAYPITKDLTIQAEEPGPKNAAELAQINDRLNNAAEIVYFTTFESAEAAATAENTLETKLRLRRIASTSDGYILAKCGGACSEKSTALRVN